MTCRFQHVETIVCRFCGAEERTVNRLVARHLRENGCGACQRTINQQARRLIQEALGEEAE